MKNKTKRLNDALSIIKELGLPKQQHNERTSLCLLALLDLTPTRDWSEASGCLIGITPIMDWAKKYYDCDYAPNTRETFRRQSMHQMVDAGIALYNPDDPKRPVNSPKAVYQIEPNLLLVLREFGSSKYRDLLSKWLGQRETLVNKYAKVREMEMIPVKVSESLELKLSVGEHSELIRDIIEKFGSRYIPGGHLLYVGDTGEKLGFFDKELLKSLGVSVDSHGKMPDVAIYCPERNWLILIESVTTHGPVDGKRHEELAKLFANCTAGLVYISAFPNRRTMNKYLDQISWETEVWVADAPTHLIHFNGSRFLGPY